MDRNSNINRTINHIKDFETKSKSNMEIAYYCSTFTKPFLVAG